MNKRKTHFVLFLLLSWMMLTAGGVLEELNIVDELHTQGVMNRIVHEEWYEHVVVEGDTLWDISKYYSGEGRKYVTIVLDNGIKNPDLIYPGQVFEVRVQWVEVKKKTNANNGGMD